MERPEATLALRGRIVEKYGTQGCFAREIGLTEQAVTAKLNGRAGFSTKDIILWANKLELGVDDIGRYFFINKLSKG